MPDSPEIRFVFITCTITNNHFNAGLWLKKRKSTLIRKQNLPKIVPGVGGFETSPKVLMLASKFPNVLISNNLNAN